MRFGGRPGASWAPPRPPQTPPRWPWTSPRHPRAVGRPGWTCRVAATSPLGRGTACMPSVYHGLWSRPGQPRGRKIRKITKIIEKSKISKLSKIVTMMTLDILPGPAGPLAVSDKCLGACGPLLRLRWPRHPGHWGWATGGGLSFFDDFGDFSDFSFPGLPWAALQSMVYTRRACSASARRRGRGDPTCPPRPPDGQGVSGGCPGAPGSRLRGSTGRLGRPRWPPIFFNTFLKKPYI